MGKQPRPGRSPLSDIERFLREVEQLRKKAAEEKAKEEPPIDEVEVVRPPRPKYRVPPPRPVIVELPPQPRTREPEVVDVIPVGRAPAPRVGEPHAASMAPSLPATASIPAPPMSAPAAPRPTSPTSVAQGARTNLATQLVHMLRSRETVPLAILLTEVLGPPRCRSRRR